MYVKIEVIFYFDIKLRSSSISPKVDGVFQFGSYCTFIKCRGPYYLNHYYSGRVAGGGWRK
jgi:hypothetical protein